MLPLLICGAGLKRVILLIFKGYMYDDLHTPCRGTKGTRLVSVNVTIMQTRFSVEILPKALSIDILYLSFQS